MLRFETNEVPAGLEAHYEDAGNGIYRLKVEGVVPTSQFDEQKNKLKEFRDNNTELKRRVDELSSFETMFKSGDFSAEKINAKVKEQASVMSSEMKTAYEAQIAELGASLQTANGRLEKIVLNNAVAAAALKHGVSETALEDVLARAKATFKVVDGELQAADDVRDAKGNPYTMDSWMASLADKATHLFKASSGAGAGKTGRPFLTPEKKSGVDLISAGLAKRR